MTSKAEEIEKIKKELQWVALKEQESNSMLSKAKEKTSNNPLIPLGCAVTAGILGYGLYCFYKRDSTKQQKMMRWRVIAQGVTIGITALSMLFSGRLKYN